MYLDEFVTKANKTLPEYPEPLKYLRGRGISAGDIEKYTLGFLKIARVKKSSSQDYKTLFASTNEFRSLQNRLIFPLRNVLGRVNGLVVRSLEKKKYTQYFMSEAKSIGAFFGLYEALPYIKSTKKVFVHEGAVDAISFAKVFPNSVSSLTSFLNEAQYEMLRFFADKIILVYDSDKAGAIGVYKMRQAYGEKHIEHIYIGDSDSNACLNMLGLERFKTFIKTRVPTLLQD